MANKISISSELANQVKWFVRQYDQMKLEYNTIAWQGHDSSEPHAHTNKTSRPVEAQAIRASYLGSSIRAIDKALEQLPEYYRKPVFEHVAHGASWPFLADRKTYLKYRRMFIFYTAKYMEWC